MTIEDRQEQAVTRVFKTVFPDTTNHYQTLFGGKAMMMMDEVAFIAATRFCRKRLVTVSSDKISFSVPIPAGTIIELVGRISHIGRTSIKVTVEIFVEQMYAEERYSAVIGEFTFVAVDENQKPTPVLD